MNPASMLSRAFQNMADTTPRLLRKLLQDFSDVHIYEDDAAKYLIAPNLLLSSIPKDNFDFILLPTRNQKCSQIDILSTFKDCR